MSSENLVEDIGWQRLLHITDNEIRGASEDIIDELYAFVLTHKIGDSHISEEPTELRNILARIQTILRLKDAEFQELLTAYDQNQKSSGGNSEENDSLRELVARQETRIKQLESGGGAIGGREVVVLRQEVDDLRIQLAEARQELNKEKFEKDKLHRELSSEYQRGKELQVEVDLKREEVEGFRNKLSAHQSGRGLVGGVMGMVEEELRERLKTQERDMAEQLDRIEELLAERQELDQKLSEMSQKLTHVQDEKTKMNEAILKHQEVLSDADDGNRALQNELKRVTADVEHLKDQLTQQKEINDQLSDIIENERQKHKEEIESRSDETNQYKEKVVQLDNQLRILLQDTNKSQVVRLSKDLSDKQRIIDELQSNLLQASEEIANLSDEMDNAKRLSDTNQATKLYTQQIEGLKDKLKEEESLLKMELDRRLQVEKERERCDQELVEVRQRLDQYESGQVGLKEAVMEIKQRKQDIVQRENEIAQLIQQVNQLQSQSDTLYDQNEALRLRLGMGPDEIVDLKEIRNRKEKEIESLKEDNRTLVMKIEKLEEEKLTLKRKLVDQSYVSRPSSRTSIQSPGMVKATPIHVIDTPSRSSPSHMMMADLNGQVTNLQTLLETERKRKEACQKEINRLTKELVDEKQTKQRHSSGDSKKAKSMVSVEEVDYSSSDQVRVLKQQNMALQMKLEDIMKENESLMRVINQPSSHKHESSIREGHSHIRAWSHTVGSPHGDQLSVVLKELRERESSLKEAREQLEHYKRKFTVVIHQQGVLYKEYHDALGKWEEEMKSSQKKIKDIEMEREHNNIRAEELKRLQHILTTGPDEMKKKIGETSRWITKLRVNERALLRRCSLMETSQTGLRKEVSQLKQSINEIQINCGQQISYLQRYKEAACFKISSLHNQLSESLPLCEVEETKKQLMLVSSQYQGLLTSLVAMETGQADERIRELSKALDESKLREDQLNRKLMNGIGRQERDYETAVDVLETTIAKLRQEKSQLDERTAVLEQQLQYRQDSAREREKEMESLRKQVIQLSVSSDQSLAIGQLQQQLTASQQNGANLLKQVQVSQSKLQEQQAQLLQLVQQSNENEDALNTVKTQNVSRIRKLQSLLLSYQRQYSGASHLVDYNKLYALLVKAKEDRQKANHELANIEEERVKVQDKHTQLMVQQRNLQELMDILKREKDSNNLINKVTEWHSKLGEMRLREVQQQRALGRLEDSNTHLKSQVTAREQDVAILEQRLVQTEKRFDDLCLCLEDQTEGRGGTRNKKWFPHEDTEIEKQSLKIPAPTQVHNEDHFSLIRTVSQLQSEAVKYETRIRELEVALSKVDGQSYNLRAVINDQEQKIMNKDNTIVQLEHKVNMLEERLVSETKHMDSRSENTIKLATDTLEQIQVQLAHKEKQLERYQELLQEQRKEHLTAMEGQRQEVDRLRRQLDLANHRIIEQKKSDNSHGGLHVHVPQDDQSGIRDQQQQQIKELQQLVKQLENSNDILNQRLEQRLQVWEEEKRELLTREDQRKSDTDTMKIKYNKQIKELQGTLCVKTERIHCLEDELESVKVELASSMESSHKRGPSKSLQGLVGKLKLQLTEKENQLEGLKKALEEVRHELVETTRKTIESQSKQGNVQLNVQKIINQKTIEIEQEFEEKIKELSEELIQKERLVEEKSKEARDFKHKHRLLEDKLSRIEKDLQNRTIELEEAENGVIEVRNQLRECQVREEKARQELKQKMSNTKEVTELREKCSQLQSRVDQQSRQIKKLQEANEESVSHRDLKNSSIEVARWEERKKWQKKLDTVKGKLTERNKELGVCQAQVASLRESVQRIEREKGLLQEKLKSMKKIDKTRKTENVSAVAEDSNNDEVYTLRAQVYEQNNQIAELQKQLQEKKTEDMSELQAENHLLKRSNEALQKELKSRDQSKGIDGSDLLLHETNLRQELVLTKKQYTQLHFRLEQAVSENLRLKTRVDELEQYIKTRNVTQLGSNTGSKDCKPGSYTAAEVDKVVSAMKKVIERLQIENDSLKRTSRKHQSKDIEMENHRLKEELLKTKQTLARLGEGKDADTPLMTVVAENDRLRNDLRKEMEKSEKLLVDVSRIKTERNHLKQRLSEHSKPQEDLVLDRDQLRQENAKLKKDLESFDPQFFEEIEDLKYKYQESLMKNAQYEEHIQLLTSQYGLTSHTPNHHHLGDGSPLAS